MRKRKKYVPAFFQVYENDSLRCYLEDMAQKGWRLSRVGSMLLHFEECRPCRMRYCVEVMEKPSAYASNQTEKRKAYREFCQDAGWEYAGTVGYLHIFYTEDEDAVLVETDSWERYERICQACQGNNRMIFWLFGMIVLLNLGSCFAKKTLLCLNGWVVGILTCAMAWEIGNVYLWKNHAQKCLQESGVLPCAPWTSVRRKNYGAVALILIASLAPSVYMMELYSSWSLAWIIGGMGIYMGLLAFVFTRLLDWVREKRDYSTRTNIIIYWGIGLAAAAVLCAGFLALIFSNVLQT